MRMARPGARAKLRSGRALPFPIMQTMADKSPVALDRLRVVQVIPVLAVGGLERMAVTLTLGLRGHVERIVVCSYRGDAFRPELAEAGVPIELIPRPRP